jgi:hypothetical protein
MGCKWIDHKNHNGLDNRKTNLRKITHQQNMMNRRPSKNSTSKYKGVSLFKRDKKWIAHICFNRILRYIGIFATEIEAAKAYNIFAKKYFGEYAYLNKF